MGVPGCPGGYSSWDVRPDQTQTGPVRDQTRPRPDPDQTDPGRPPDPLPLAVTGEDSPDPSTPRVKLVPDHSLKPARENVFSVGFADYRR